MGATDTESVVDALTNGLGIENVSAEPIEKNTPAIPLTDVKSIKCREGEQRVCEDLPVQQSALVIGLRTPAAVQDEDFFAVALYNELLGSSSPVSKLFINVREKLGLCYSCFSTYNAYKAALTICCSLEDDRREEAEAEIRRQLDALVAGDISDAEWQAAKKSMENAYRQLSDSPSATEVYYLGRALAGIPISPKEGSARIAALGRDVADNARFRAVIKQNSTFFKFDFLDGRLYLIEDHLIDGNALRLTVFIKGCLRQFRGNCATVFPTVDRSKGHAQLLGEVGLAQPQIFSYTLD